KDASGNWKDGTTTLTVNGDGAVEVPVPTGVQLKEGDIVKAQAEDKANTKAKSPIVTKAVGRSKKKTPTPTLEKITAEDTTFIIKPIDNTSENIITDTMVVTIKDNMTNTTVKKIILKKQSKGNWRIQGTSTDIVPDGEGKLTVDPGLAFKAEYSLGATAEDKTHGHSISDPTSVKVNAKQSNEPSYVKQLKNDDAQKFHVFKGKGVPGALINIYSPGGDQIAIPVTVGNDGFFEAKIPQENMPADGKIQFAQKIEERPESEKVDAELKITKPTLKLGDLDAGATTITLNTISEDCTRIIVTLPDNTTKELTKNNVGNWLDSNNKVVGTGPNITDLDAPQLKNNDIVKAVGYDEYNNISKEEKTIVGDKASFTTEKPQQEKRDDNYNVIISAVIPAGSNPANNTVYTLCKENGTEVAATVSEKDGKVVFTVTDGVLAHGVKVKVKVKEPGKPEKFSEVSKALDLNGPVITAQDIKGRVGVPLKDSTTNQIKVEDETSPGLEELAYFELPQKLQIVKDGAIWKVKGAVPYRIEAADNVTITYTGKDQWGNKTGKIVNVWIEDKTAVDTPKIDPLKKGSKTVKITPPLKGDTLVVTIGDDTVTLTKKIDPNTNEVTWNDGTITYPLTSGKIDVKVPDDEGLEVGDIVTAQGKDSTGILADSPIATDSVKQSNLKTPTPQFEQVTVGDTTFTIEPINQGVIVVDRLVITIRNETTEEAKLILTKDDSGNWTDQDNNPITKEGNKLKVSVPSGITLTPNHSFGATAEDVFHGHAISDPTSINVNAKQSDKPTAEQGKTKENGNPTITGTGVAGADINVYDPTTGNLIAGPVKVKPDGTYEIEVPKDSVPHDGKVIVKQKEDGKPESEPTNVTIDKTAPDAPLIDPTNVGDTTIQITPPDEAEKLIITLPDGSKKELTKKNATTWTDGATDYPVSGGKI
ncbi:MAG: hypothetical protein Q4P25_05330, partial [Tissierellia bacterium]|nr:hypothetical protein [Tissierellia bacterium]